jgi:pyruvate/2-oxoglutarate dehydrogenase complex dihydrolipoamide dehydrogenase (E3) component
LIGQLLIVPPKDSSRYSPPPEKDKILVVTIVGPHAGDLLAENVLAMKHGIELNKILGTFHVYPS